MHAYDRPRFAGFITPVSVGVAATAGFEPAGACSIKRRRGVGTAGYRLPNVTIYLEKDGQIHLFNGNVRYMLKGGGLCMLGLR